MFSFFKEKITAADLGAELLKFTNIDGKIKESFSTTTLLDLSDPRYFNEVKCLRIAAIDFVIREINDIFLKESVLIAFYDRIKEMTENVNLCQIIDERIEVYEEIFMAPRSSKKRTKSETAQILLNVGKTFTRLCEKGEDELDSVGIGIFTSAYGECINFMAPQQYLWVETK